jgi:ferrous iron transport protein A
VSTLDRLAVGASATVVRVEGTDEISCRLMEMGLTPGAAIQMIGAAPLGDPLELELRGYRLSVRRAEAARVAIQMTNEQAPMTN